MDEQEPFDAAQDKQQLDEQQPIEPVEEVTSTPSSRKKLIIGIVVAFVLFVVGSVGAYFLLQPNTQQVNDSPLSFEGKNDYLIEEKEQAKSNPVSAIYLVNHNSSIDSESLKNVAEEIESELKVPVRIKEIYYASPPQNDSYYSQKKEQYDGDALWNYYANIFRAPESNARTVHIIGVDLFTKLSIFRPYILSRVLPNEEHILISDYRLKNENEDLYRLRLKKLALYNLGKSVALGIYSPHRNDSECLTSSIKTVEDLDALNESFCQNTQPLLSEVFAAPEINENGSNWKTYRNEEYEFEFKYPIDFKEQKAESDMALLKITKTDGGSLYVFGIHVMKNYEISQIVSKVEEVKEINIENHLGYEYFYIEGAGMSEVALIQVGQDALSISFDLIGNGQNFATANDRKIYVQDFFNQILSTFKFIETQSEEVDQKAPINLIACKMGERRTLLHGLGSITLVVTEQVSDTCILEYTDELEGGYTTYKCTMPPEIERVSLSTLDVSKYCKEVRSGNFLLESIN